MLKAILRRQGGLSFTAAVTAVIRSSVVAGGRVSSRMRPLSIGLRSICGSKKIGERLLYGPRRGRYSVLIIGFKLCCGQNRSFRRGGENETAERNAAEWTFCRHALPYRSLRRGGRNTAAVRCRVAKEEAIAGECR